MTTALPSLVLDVSRGIIERLNDSLDLELKRGPNPGTAEEVVYLAFRTFQDIAWTWNRLHEELGTGMPGPIARQTFPLVIGMFEEWLKLANSSKRMAASVQASSGTSDKVRKKLMATVEEIEVAIEKIGAAREEARGIMAMLEAPMHDVDPARITEAEELYLQGRFVDFKEAIARCRAE